MQTHRPTLFLVALLLGGCDPDTSPSEEPSAENPGGKADDADARDPTSTSASELAEGWIYGALSDDERAEVDALRFDVNDVSYLWPVGGHSFTFSEDAVSAELQPIRPLIPNGDLLTRMAEFFSREADVIHPWTGERVGPDGFSDSFHPSDLASAMRVVAFRFDDCAPGTHHEGLDGPRSRAAFIRLQDGVKQPPNDVFLPCVPQLRLVAQFSSDEDAAIHLVYTYVESPMTFLADAARDGTYVPLTEVGLAVAQDLQVLKWLSPASTDGLPLGVHPGLSDSAFRQWAAEFVAFYARPEYLTNIAFLSTNDSDGGHDWEMALVNIDPDATYATADDLDLSPMAPVQGSPISLGFSTGRDAFEVEFGPSVPATVDAIRADELVAVTNPKLSQLPSTDCVSCHRETTAYRDLLVAGETSKLRVALASPSAYVPPRGTTAFVDPDAMQLHGVSEPQSFHNFGHLFGEPSVSLRTANESADVAGSLNVWLHDDETGPGLDCSIEARQRILFDAFVAAGEDPFEPAGAWADLSLAGCDRLGD